MKIGTNEDNFDEMILEMEGRKSAKRIKQEKELGNISDTLEEEYRRKLNRGHGRILRIEPIFFYRNLVDADVYYVTASELMKEYDVQIYRPIITAYRKDNNPVKLVGWKLKE